MNEFHAGFLRNVNDIGQPHGGAGCHPAVAGFCDGRGHGGIVVQAPQFEGVENIVFPSFVMGVPMTNLDQWNNTLYLSDTLSKVIGDAHAQVRRPVSRRPGQRKPERDIQRDLQHRRH